MATRVLVLLLAALPAAAFLAGGCAPSDPDTPRDVEVSVGGVGVDPMTDSMVMLLEERDGERALPIWIGESEARSIAVEMENQTSPRPNTHDLAKRLLNRLDADVERVVVTELRRGTYFAVMVLRSRGQRLEIDARPSDAIAIGLRVEAPLFVRESLFRAVVEHGEREAEESGEELRL